MKKLCALIVLMTAFSFLPKMVDAAEIPLSTTNPSYNEAKYLYDLEIIDDTLVKSLDDGLPFSKTVY